MAKQKPLHRIGLAIAGIFILTLFGFTEWRKWYPTESTQKIVFAQFKQPAAKTVTVVSAYYSIPSKHSQSEYLKWMGNFLPKIPCYLYIFTSRADYPILAKLRESHLPRTKFIIKEFSELQEAKRMAMWKKQHEIDPENSYHSPELYIVWAEKIHMVMEAIEDNAFSSDYFIWCDMGSFRTAEFSKNLISFPDYNKTTAILKEKDKVTLLLLEPFPANSSIMGPNGLPIMDFSSLNRIGGAIMAGHKIAWNNWNNLYYDTLELMLKSQQFIGKDQTIMNNAAIKYPNFFNLVSPEAYFEGKADPWFYLQFYFS